MEHARPGDTPAGRTGLRGAGGRTLVPPRGLGHRRAAGHRPARRAGRGRPGAHHAGRHLDLPCLRDHCRGGPAAWRREPAGRDPPGHRRAVAGHPHRRGRARDLLAAGRADRARVRRVAAGSRPGRQLPQDQPARCPRDAPGAGRDRGAPRAAGHPYPADRRGGRQPGQRGAERPPGAGLALGDRRLGLGHRYRTDQCGRGLPGHGAARRAARGCPLRSRLPPACGRPP